MTDCHGQQTYMEQGHLEEKARAKTEYENIKETRRTLRERRPPPRPSHILNKKYKLDRNKF